MTDHLPDELHVEEERGPARYDVPRPLLTVAQLGRHNQPSLLT